MTAPWSPEEEAAAEAILDELEPAITRGFALDLARAALRAAEKAAWRPIETAPDDFLLVTEGGAIRAMLKEEGEWKSLAVALDEYGDVAYHVKVRESAIYNPTHWRPLPAPPGDEASESNGLLAQLNRHEETIATEPAPLNRRFSGPIRKPGDEA